MRSRYTMFAGYNSWCNGRLYDAAATVSDAEYRSDHGVFFKSLHGTLNPSASRRSHLDVSFHRRR